MKQPVDEYSLFEYCLSRLEAGEDLETILADYPEKSIKLRPLLLAALKAQHAGAPLRIPASAQIDSRTRFLAEASRMQSKPRRTLFGMRFATATALVVIAILAGLFSTGLASAQTVPGEALYPVKLVVEKAQMAITSNQSARLELEEEFDRRRVAETEKLAKTGRSESVTLAGPLVETDDQSWLVGGVPLKLTKDQESIARSLNGSYIEVKGRVRGEDGLEVEDMELRLFTFSGVLDAMNPGEWTVSGVKVLMMETTQITGNPRLGRRVEMTTLHHDDEYFLALSVRVMGGGKNNHNESTPNASNNQNGNNPIITASIEPEEEPTQEFSKTPEPESTEAGHDREPTRGQSTEDNHEKTKTPQPEETHEPTKTPD